MKKLRTCIMCNKKFLSDFAGNRHCAKCKYKISNQDIQLDKRVALFHYPRNFKGDI